MKFNKIVIPDNVNYFIERLTAVTAPEREPIADKYISVLILISNKTSEILSFYTTPAGVRPANSNDKIYTKGDLCVLLLNAYCKNWYTKDKDWQASEAQQLRKICVEKVGEMRKKIKSIGYFKITKQIMIMAILHRIVSTQDVKEFFNKTL